MGISYGINGGLPSTGDFDCEREKLTEDVRLRVEDYARLSMQPLLRAGYARNATVTARIIVP
ncbi:hypothetical protein ACSLPG_36930, partial [Escherichia coli]